MDFTSNTPFVNHSHWWTVRAKQFDKVFSNNSVPLSTGQLPAVERDWLLPFIFPIHMVFYSAIAFYPSTIENPVLYRHGGSKGCYDLRVKPQKNVRLLVLQVIGKYFVSLEKLNHSLHLCKFPLGSLPLVCLIHHPQQGEVWNQGKRARHPYLPALVLWKMAFNWQINWL